MDKLLPRLLAFYSLILVSGVFILGIVTARNDTTIVIQIFLLPVIIYLVKLILTKSYPPMAERKMILGSSALILVLLTAFSLVSMTNTNAEKVEEDSPESSPIVFRAENKKIAEDTISIDYLVIKLPDEGSFLNVREEPSSKTDVVGQALPGQRFKIVGEVDDWFQIELEDGITGWVHKDFSLKE